MKSEHAKIGGISVSEEQVRQVMGSDAGKQLIALLQKKGGTSLQQAVQAAQGGDTSGAKNAIESLLKDPAAADLLSRLNNG